MTAPLILYIGDKAYSTWSMRPWLVLKHAGLDFEERVIRMYQDGSKAAISAISPNGRLPSLHHGDFIVSESLAIAEYAAELRPEAQLWPSDLKARAHARAIANEMHAGFSALRQTCGMNITDHRPGGVAMSAEATADVGRIIQIWEETRAAFGGSGPYLFGRFSIADAMFAPVVFRFVTYDIDPSHAAGDYLRVMWDDPAVKEWVRGAEVETGGTAPRPKARP